MWRGLANVALQTAGAGVRSTRLGVRVAQTASRETTYWFTNQYVNHVCQRRPSALAFGAFNAFETGRLGLNIAEGNLMGIIGNATTMLASKYAYMAFTYKNYIKAALSSRLVRKNLLRGARKVTGEVASQSKNYILHDHDNGARAFAHGKPLLHCLGRFLRPVAKAAAEKAKLGAAQTSEKITEAAATLIPKLQAKAAETVTTITPRMQQQLNELVAAARKKIPAPTKL